MTAKEREELERSIDEIQEIALEMGKPDLLIVAV